MWTIFCSFAFILFVAEVQSQGGAYKMSLYQLATCDEPVGNLKFPTRIKKLSRSVYVYSCNCTIGDGFNDNQSLNLNLATFGNGGWKPNFLNLQYKKVCQDAWPIIGKSAVGLLSKNHTVEIKCPLPPGVYEINEYRLDMTKYEKIFPVLPYGRFRVDIDFRIKSKRSQCIRLYIDIDPKQKLRG